MRSFVGVTKSRSFSQAAGEQDSVLSIATVRRAGELLPRAQVEIVPGAPHSMYWETPALFNDAVGRFLARVYATAPATTEPATTEPATTGAAAT